jgi:hypothetical protein
MRGSLRRAPRRPDPHTRTSRAIIGRARNGNRATASEFRQGCGLLAVARSHPAPPSGRPPNLRPPACRLKCRHITSPSEGFPSPSQLRDSRRWRCNRLQPGCHSPSRHGGKSKLRHRRAEGHALHDLPQIASDVDETDPVLRRDAKLTPSVGFSRRGHDRPACFLGEPGGHSMPAGISIAALATGE